MEMTSFTPEEFFWGGGVAKWCLQKDAYKKTWFSSITWLELHSVEHNNTGMFFFLKKFNKLGVMGLSCMVTLLHVIRNSCIIWSIS